MFIDKLFIMPEVPSFHIYYPITTPSTHIYKLIQLPPALTDYIKENEYESNENQLVIKSSKSIDNDLVLVNPDNTWKIRQMNHSNSVVLLNNMNVNKLNHSLDHISSTQDQLPDKLLGITNLSYEYEISKVDGKIDISKLPDYDGSEIIGEYEILIDDFINDSLISRNQFLAKWYNYCGCEINNRAVILTSDFVSEILHNLIPVLISNDIPYESEEYNLNLSHISKLMLEQNSSFTQNILVTILSKFGQTKNNTDFKLNNNKISKWFGIQTLIKLNHNLISTNQFLINWKSALPSFYNIPIDLMQLRGYYCRPLNDDIQYLNPENLSNNDISSRIKDLFKIVNSWDFDEFYPFIIDFIPPGRKPDLIILKFARKKRSGKNKFIVSPR